MATVQQSKPLRLSHGTTQFSAVNHEKAANLRTNGVYYLSDTLATVGAFVANNWGYIDLPVGRYTYRQWGLSIIAPAAIVGKTDIRDGVNVVKTANISEYVDSIVIEINGQAKWEMTADELMKYNNYQNHDTADGVLRIVFGSPNIHNTDIVEDAYQLGTGNLRSVKLRIKTKAAWVSGMLPVLNVEYAPVSRPIGYFQTTTRYAYTNPGAGAYSITDIAVGLDFSTIWVQGANIKRGKLTIDRNIVLDQSTWNLRAMHTAWGKDVDGLGAGIIFDAFRDGDGVGVDSISDQLAERARGADVRLDLDMATAGNALTLVVLHCGLFAQQ